MNLSKSICALFKQQNISHIFAMSGANNEILLKEIYEDSYFTLTIVKNEANAVFMAMGHYLKCHKIAAVVTTSGAAILNTISPLTEAYSSKIPLLVIGGQIEQKFEGLGAFQDNSGLGNSLNILEFFKPTTSYQKRIEDINSSLENINKAIDITKSSKKPSLILIPKNLMTANAPSLPQGLNTNISETVLDIDLQNIDLVIIGEELLHLEDSSKLITLSRELKSKIALTPVTKGLYDNLAESFAGITGVMGNELFNKELDKAKSILLLGTSWDVITRFETENKLLDKDIISIGEVEHKIFCKSYQSYNYSGVSFVNKFFSSNELSPLKREIIKLENRFDWKEIISTIDQSLEVDADIFVDAGNTGAQCVKNLRPRGSAQFFLSLGQGGMGNSIGAAIGCSATTKKRSYIFCGDGSFLINGLELHTAIENDLPLCVFVFNNNSHGMCSVREELFLNKSSKMNNFKKSHFANGMKEMFQNVESFEVDSMSQLISGLEEMKYNKEQFYIFNINISEIEIPPFKTFEKQMEINNANR